MTHRWIRGILVPCAIVALGFACREPLLVRRNILDGSDSAAIRAHQTRMHSLAMTAATSQGRCFGFPGYGCTLTTTSTPANFCGRDGTCTYQMSPITTEFTDPTGASKPVYQLIVTLGGAMTCDGTYGTVTAYNLSGTQVEQSDMVLMDPSDCGYDRVTLASVDTIHYAGAIRYVTITPPQPGVFIVHKDPSVEGPDTTTGRLSAIPSAEFYEQRAPTAIGCLTGDELLDQQAMRDLLNDLWTRSHVTNPPATRTEVRGYLFEDATGNVIYGAYPDIQDTPCKSFGVPPNPLPGFILATVHTHPWTDREAIPIGVCGVTKSGSYYDSKLYGGPSDTDYGIFNQVLAPLYTMDKDNIYVAPVGTTKFNWNGRVTTYPRVGPGSCTLP